MYRRPSPRCGGSSQEAKKRSEEKGVCTARRHEDRGIACVSAAINKNLVCSYHLEALSGCFQLIVLRPKAAIFNHRE